MNNSRGFTLIEVLIAMLISAVLGIAITSLYINNLRVNTDQTTVVRVQQNIRATSDYLAREIRMAGYIGAHAVTAGIKTATEGRFRFTYYDENAAALRDLDITLNNDADVNGVLDGGISNNTGTELGIQFGGAGGYSPLAENIHAIGFSYAISNGNELRTYTTTGGDNVILWVIPDPAGSGNWMSLDTDGNGQIDTNDDTDNNGELDLVDTGIATNLSTIRIVKFSVLGTAYRNAQEYTNNEQYVVGRQVLTANDSIRRRLLTTTVTCRNLGL